MEASKVLFKNWENEASELTSNKTKTNKALVSISQEGLIARNDRDCGSTLHCGS